MKCQFSSVIIGSFGVDQNMVELSLFIGRPSEELWSFVDLLKVNPLWYGSIRNWAVRPSKVVGNTLWMVPNFIFVSPSAYHTHFFPKRWGTRHLLEMLEILTHTHTMNDIPTHAWHKGSYGRVSRCWSFIISSQRLLSSASRLMPVGHRLRPPGDYQEQSDSQFMHLYLPSMGRGEGDFDRPTQTI